MPCWEEAGPERRPTQGTDRFPRTPAPSPAAAGVSPSAAAAALVPAKPQPLGLATSCFFSFFSLSAAAAFFPPPAPPSLQRSKWKALKPRRFLVKNPPGFAAPPQLGSPSRSPPPPLQHREKKTFFTTANLSLRHATRLGYFALSAFGGKEEGGSPGGPGAADQRLHL